MYRRMTAIIVTLVMSSVALAGLLAGFGSVAEVKAQGGPVRIRDIQGAGHTSPLLGQVVSNVHGIVTAVEPGDGFYLQDPNPDASNATAEGIFIDDVTVFPNVGDEVLITGTVEEGGFSGELTTTRLEISGTATISSTGNPLPAPVVIGNGGRVPPNQNIEDDGLANFEPDTDGIDFYESLEGMLIQVNDALVVGPTNAFGEFVVVGDGGANAGQFTPANGLIVQPDYSDFNPERIIFDDELTPNEPQLTVGATFTQPITGVVSYSFGSFKMLNPVPLPAPGSPVQPETTGLGSLENHLTIASYNVLNLDPSDPITQFNRLAANIVNNLQTPDIIALQEIQDNTGAVNDGTVVATATYTTLITAIQTAGGPAYEFTDIPPVNNQDGGAPGSNIRVGYLYNPARVTLANRPKGDATTAVTVTTGISGPQLSLNPGRIDPTNLVFTDSRKSLAAEFHFGGETIIVINNHFNSKSDDDALFGDVQPPTRPTEVQRNAIAQRINDFVDAILAVDAEANVIVIGDLNDFYFSPAISDTLTGGVLTNLMTKAPANDRYSFIFEGNSQTLDHILVTNRMRGGSTFDIVHVNTNFPASAAGSDHDPLLARVLIGPAQLYLPIIRK